MEEEIINLVICNGTGSYARIKAMEERGWGIIIGEDA